MSERKFGALEPAGLQRERERETERKRKRDRDRDKERVSGWVGE